MTKFLINILRESVTFSSLVSLVFMYNKILIIEEHSFHFSFYLFFYKKGFFFCIRKII